MILQVPPTERDGEVRVVQSTRCICGQDLGAPAFDRGVLRLAMDTHHRVCALGVVPHPERRFIEALDREVAREVVRRG